MAETMLLAFAASVPLALLGLGCGLAAERLGAGLRARAALWSLALVLPMALLPAFVTLDRLDVHSPLAVRSALIAPLAEVSSVGPAVEPFEARPSAFPDPPAASPSVAWPAPRPSWLVGLVLGGAAIWWTALLLRMLRLRRLVRASRPCADEALVAILRREAAEMGTPAPELRIEPEGGAPVLAGLRRPVILAPAAMLGGLCPDRFALICGHELAHLKRGDNLRGLVEEVLLGLFWFNPFLRMVRGRLAAVREEICDDLALRAVEPSRRRAYAESLLYALRLEAGASPAMAFTGWRGAAVRRRLAAILKPVRGSFLGGAGVAALAPALFLAAGAASLTLAAAPPSRAAAIAAISSAIGSASEMLAPATTEAMVEGIQQRRAAPAAVRFEVRMLGGTDRVYSDLVGAPRGDGWAFLLEPTLRSTYEDGPTVRLSPEADLDAALARFSTNELRWRKLTDASTALGAAAVLDNAHLFTGQPRNVVTSVQIAPDPQGRPQGQMSVINAAQGALITGAVSGLPPPASVQPLRIVGFTTSRPRTPGAPGFNPPYLPGGLAERALSNSGPQTTISLRPTLRSNGKMAVEITAQTVFAERPILRLEEGPGADERDDVFAELLPAPGQSGEPTRKVMHYVQTGVSPELVRTRSSTLEVADRQVIAIVGMSSTMANGSDVWASGGGILLIRPVLEPALP